MKISSMILTGLLIFSIACNIDEIPDPNNPSASSLQEGASLSDLQLLVSGIESEMRDEMGFYYDVLGIVGREYYFFTNSDPRYTGEILGKAQSTLDNAGFYVGRPYSGRYKVVKNANILLKALENTTASLSQEELNGFIGLAKTAQAYSLLLVLNMQNSNGIRVDVADPDNLGPFLSRDASLAAISALLDEGNAALNTAEAAFFMSEAFPFVFNGSDPDYIASLRQFNRAIKARVEIYRGNKADAITALNNSFFNLSGDLNVGPRHFYSSAGTDLPNLVFRVPNQSEALVAHPSFVTDILTGDNRIAKVAQRTSTAVLDGLSGDYDVVIYSSIASFIPIIRNEELILIYAEANIGSNNNEAVNALNRIRNAHNLPDYTGGTTDAELIDELLYNRRYSLFGEAHRWIDMRRFGRLNQLPIDRTDDDVWTEFPRPVDEIGVQGG